METHELKLSSQYFKAVEDGSKPFEIRFDDRNYQVGDILILKEVENKLRKSALGDFLLAEYTGREIKKEISYKLKDFEAGLKEGWCVLGLKQEGIQLKNIDLTGISEEEQWEKMCEEENEFAEAYFQYRNDKTEGNKNHVIEELFDEFQSKLGLLEKEGITAKEVMEQYYKHMEKLKSRPRNKRCSKCALFSTCLETETLKDYDEYAKECDIYEESEK